MLLPWSASLGKAPAIIPSTSCDPPRSSNLSAATTSCDTIYLPEASVPYQTHDQRPGIVPDPWQKLQVTNGLLPSRPTPSHMADFVLNFVVVNQSSISRSHNSTQLHLSISSLVPILNLSSKQTNSHLCLQLNLFPSLNSLTASGPHAGHLVKCFWRELNNVACRWFQKTFCEATES